MATMKPRITITLEPHRHELLRRLAAARGVTMSAVVGELVETASDAMERVVVLLEAASRAPVEMNEGLRAALKVLGRDFEHHASRAIDSHDLFMDIVEGEAAPGADPRLVITGVRSPAEKGANPGGARVSGDSARKAGSHDKVLRRRARA